MKIRERLKSILSYDFWVILIGIVVFLSMLGLILWCLYSVGVGVLEAIGKINDPTERGMAYVAVSIAFHAFFGKSNTDVKVNDKSR